MNGDATNHDADLLAGGQDGVARPRLLFVSNLFPDERQPVRGQDNAVLLGYLRAYYDCRALVPRPTLACWKSTKLRPLGRDAWLKPIYMPVPYVPKLGDRWNHRFMHWRLKPWLDNAAAQGWCDRLLVSWLYPDGCAVARWSAARGIPTTMIAQGSDVHQYLQRPLRKSAILQAVKDCRSVITRSSALRDLLLDAGAPADAVECVYNGVDTGTFRGADQSEARRSLGLADHGRIVLFVGNLLPVKNPRLLLETFSLWNERTTEPESPAGRRHHQLVVIGTGPLEPELRELATRLGISDRVRWLGRQPSDQVALWMQASDALLMTSHNEGLPNVVLEAMACGLPIVSTDVGGIGELVRPPQAGRLVKPGPRIAEDLKAALAEVVDQQTVDRQRLASMGRKRDWTSAAEAYHRHQEQNATRLGMT